MLSSRQWLAVTVSMAVIGTVVVAWATTRWWWLNQPISPEARSVRAELVLDAAERMQAGESMLDVEAAMGIDLRPDWGPPEGPPQGPPPRTGLFVRTRYDGQWARKVDAPGLVWERPGPEREVAAWTGERWIILHNDAVPPGIGLLGLFLLAAAPLLAVGVGITGRAMTPVEAAEAALERLEAGARDQLLDEESGPPELRRMARAINGLARETERLVQRERQRMAGLSHEMRTPLTRARLELELARRAGADTTRIARVEGEIERLDALVQELLDLARLEGGQGGLRVETVELRGLTFALLDDEEEDGVTVEGDGLAAADPRLLRRALANLLRNSRQHAPGAARRVRLGPGLIEVADDGPGVSAADAERLFDVFWRGADRTEEGHGLGLAIVQEIAQIHGGSVEVESPPGFLVRLRLPRAEG